MRPPGIDIDGFSPFVVMGASKSGTTWVQRICDAHPQLRCHFQLPIFPMDKATHPQLFEKAAVVYNARHSPFGGVFPNQRTEDEYRWTHQFLEQLDILRSAFVSTHFGDCSSAQQKFTAELQRTSAQGIIARLLRDVPDKRAYGTKAYTDLDLLFSVYPAARVIHIVRDGRDVCVSKRFHTLRMGAYYLGDEKSGALNLLDRIPAVRLALLLARRRLDVFGPNWFRQPGHDSALLSPTVIKKFASDWKFIVEYVEHHRRERPEHILQLRYEELKSSPQAELSKLFDFLSVDASTETVESVRSATSFSRSQDSTKEQGFFRKGAVGDWRNHFLPSDRRLFDECAGSTLRTLGYESDSGWLE